MTALTNEYASVPSVPDDRETNARNVPDLLERAAAPKELRLVPLTELQGRPLRDPSTVRRFADVLPDTPPPSVWGTRRRTPTVPTPLPPAETREVHTPASAERRQQEREHFEISRLARLVAQSAFEVLVGGRAVTQMRRWLDAPVLEHLRQRSELALRNIGPERVNRTIGVRRSRLCRISDDVFEASVAVQCHDRHRAAALRIERRRGQWKVSALELG